MRLHAGTALRYPCPHCAKRFSHPSEVKQHQAVHTGLRLYCCPGCGNRYSRYPSLWKHRRKCHSRQAQGELLASVAPLLTRVAGQVMLHPNLPAEAVIVDTVTQDAVVVDEVIVTENVDNDVMLPLDTFTMEES